VPSAARFRREVARSRVMVGCWFGLIRRGGDPLGEFLFKLLKESAHGAGVDGRVIPANAVASSTQEATDLPFHHAADKPPPVPHRGAVGFGKFNDRLSGVVQELIVLDPEGGVPGFVVRVTVVGSGAHRIRLN